MVSGHLLSISECINDGYSLCELSHNRVVRPYTLKSGV